MVYMYTHVVEMYVCAIVTSRSSRRRESSGMVQRKKAIGLHTGQRPQIYYIRTIHLNKHFFSFGLLDQWRPRDWTRPTSTSTSTTLSVKAKSSKTMRSGSCGLCWSSASHNKILRSKYGDIIRMLAPPKKKNFFSFPPGFIIIQSLPECVYTVYFYFYSNI